MCGGGGAGRATELERFNGRSLAFQGDTVQGGRIGTVCLFIVFIYQ